MPTKIPWVINPDGSPGDVLNLTTGCTGLSEGCARCYARRLANSRLKGRCGYPADNPFQIVLHPDRLLIPLKKKKPTTYFVCSMGDFFHPKVPLSFHDQFFDIAVRTPQHNYLLLSKFTQEMLKHTFWSVNFRELKPNNVFCGASVENDKHYRRFNDLLGVVGDVGKIFLSLEPLLGSVSIPAVLLKKLSCVIVGGENGPGARCMDPSWTLSIRNQCIDAGVPFFFKGWGDYWRGNLVEKYFISDRLPWGKNNVDVTR
jgi:protein gp37